MALSRGRVNGCFHELCGRGNKERQVTRVTIPGTGMEGALHQLMPLTWMFVHHFLAILSPLLGGILLPTKGKPSCPLLSYSCNFSWQPINQRNHKPAQRKNATSALGKSQKKNWRESRQTIFMFQKVRSPFISGSVLQQWHECKMNQIPLHQKINPNCTLQRKGQPSLLVVLFSRAFIILNKFPGIELAYFSPREPYNISEWSLLKLEPRLLIQQRSNKSEHESYTCQCVKDHLYPFYLSALGTGTKYSSLCFI